MTVPVNDTHAEATMKGGHRRVWTIAWAAALALGAASPALEAQVRGEARPEVGVGFVGADPRGEMGLLVDQGWGGQLYGTWPLDPAGHVRIRGDLGFVIYGHERYRSCFNVPVGCRIEIDLTTTNNIFYGGMGPELVLATGSLRPYLNASFGFAYFATTSSLSGTGDQDDFANTTNFDDSGFAWSAGGGLRISLSRGRHPVALDLGVERRNNGVMEYLTEGDIVDHPDGSITVYPTRSEANLVTFRLGVSIGIPRGGTHGRHRRR